MNKNIYLKAAKDIDSGIESYSCFAIVTHVDGYIKPHISNYAEVNDYCNLFSNFEAVPLSPITIFNAVIENENYSYTSEKEFRVIALLFMHEISKDELNEK